MIFHKPGRHRTAHLSSPARSICTSFLIVITIGTLLLTLPISSQDRQFTSVLDALFTATSATCVTGLIVFDTATKWSLFGKVIILTLIQVGGLGLVTITTFLNIAIGKRLGFHYMQRAQEAISLESTLDFNSIIRIVIKATMAVEGVGALILCLVFVPKYGIIQGIGISVFLAISAFCNAGFDVLGFEEPFTSLTAYNDNPVVILTVSLLIIVGGLGFIVWYDCKQYLRTRKLMLHTRVVLSMTAILIVTGTVFFLVCEWNNPYTLQPMPLDEKLAAAYFQSVTCRTAGFNSIDIAAMHPLTKILSMLLMFVGAAPGSTGGGIKVTTMAVIAMTIVSVVKGRQETIVMRRIVPKNTVYRSLAIIVLAALLVFVAGGIIYFTLPVNTLETGIDALFEAVSAFATVGLTAGVSAVANVPSKLILILTMFTGRVGPISFILSLAARSGSNPFKGEVLPNGKIMVG